MVDGWKIGGCTLGWMNVRPGGWMEGRMNRQTDQCAHGWRDEWKYGWVDGSTECVPGWTEGIL